MRLPTKDNGVAGGFENGRIPVVLKGFVWIEFNVCKGKEHFDGLYSVD